MRQSTEQRSDSYVPLRSNLTVDGQILEAWGEGWNVGALVILLLIVFCNYRRRNTLHKLILLEVSLDLTDRSIHVEGAFPADCKAAPSSPSAWYLHLCPREH